MLPYAVENWPAARVATQPPTVESSIDCGQWPIVRPASDTRRSAASPFVPARNVARRSRSSSDDEPVHAPRREHDRAFLREDAAADAGAAAVRHDRRSRLAREAQHRAPPPPRPPARRRRPASRSARPRGRAAPTAPTCRASAWPGARAPCARRRRRSPIEGGPRDRSSSFLRKGEIRREPCARPRDFVVPPRGAPAEEVGEALRRRRERRGARRRIVERRARPPVVEILEMAGAFAGHGPLDLARDERRPGCERRAAEREHVARLGAVEPREPRGRRLGGARASRGAARPRARRRRPRSRRPRAAAPRRPAARASPASSAARSSVARAIGR